MSLVVFPLLFLYSWNSRVAGDHDLQPAICLFKGLCIFPSRMAKVNQYLALVSQILTLNITWQHLVISAYWFQWKICARQSTNRSLKTTNWVWLCSPRLPCCSWLPQPARDHFTTDHKGRLCAGNFTVISDSTSVDAGWPWLSLKPSISINNNCPPITTADVSRFAESKSGSTISSEWQERNKL